MLNNSNTHTGSSRASFKVTHRLKSIGLYKIAETLVKDCIKGALLQILGKFSI